MGSVCILATAARCFIIPAEHRQTTYSTAAHSKAPFWAPSASSSTLRPLPTTSPVVTELITFVRRRHAAFHQLPSRQHRCRTDKTLVTRCLRRAVVCAVVCIGVQCGVQLCISPYSCEFGQNRDHMVPLACAFGEIDCSTMAF